MLYCKLTNLKLMEQVFPFSVKGAYSSGVCDLFFGVFLEVAEWWPVTETTILTCDKNLWYHTPG